MVLAMERAIDRAVVDRVEVRETSVHIFEGDYPEVPTYDFVNTELLYENDAAPFHITLRVAELGQVSANGLLYDEDLVSRIEEGLQHGAEGIGGHIPDSEAGTAFPISEVFWIGHKRVNETTWAKGYIPPGQRREDIRRKKATHGQIGTSIYGSAIPVAVARVAKELKEAAKGKKVWRAEEFELDQLDLAPVKKQSLKKKGDFVITSETEHTDTEDIMSDKKDVIAELTIGDIPATIREQIIKDAQVQADAARVAELKQTISEQEKQITELRKYTEIVGEIRSTLELGNDADTVEIVRQMHEQLVNMAERLGVDSAGVEVRVYELHDRVGEFERQTFERSIGDKVVELTNWQTQTDEGKKRLTALRQMMTKRTIGAIGDERADDKIAETVKTLWDEEFQAIAESVRDTLAGPSAIISGQQSTNGSGWKPAEDGKAARGNLGI